MKMIAIVLSLCFTFNVFAGSVSELEKAFDAYNYAVTVEWDQKDPAFHEAQTKLLLEKITTLRNEGLSREEILATVENKVANKEAFEALKLKLSLLKAGSVEELALMIRETSNDMYSHGASWSGNVAVYIFPAVILAVVIYAIATAKDYECVRWEVGEYCEGGTYVYCGYGEHCAEYQAQD
jgi:hypothetical protein